MAYYAVRKGRTPGVYKTWDQAKAQIQGFRGPEFKKFDTLQEAEEFITNVYHRQTRLTEFFERSEDPQENDKLLICFTDGSTIGNGRDDARGGYAVVWPYHQEFDCSIPLFPATNNKAEYSAVIHAFSQADELDPERKKTLVIYSDSELLINSMTKWLPGWRANGYKKSDGQLVKNLDLVKALEEAMSHRPTAFRHVRAHTGGQSWEAIQNDKVDRLAKLASGAKTT
jgi:ribonuclease HI